MGHVYKQLAPQTGGITVGGNTAGIVKPENAQAYLSSTGWLEPGETAGKPAAASSGVEQKIVGFEENDYVFELLDVDKKTIASPMKDLAIQIGDYMPFQTNIVILLGVFLLQNLVYQLVQLSFQRAVRRTVVD